tara:strand:+ start:435 stop:1184 length:750 start_codon:yes stop_codon:yes gene_type:complete
MRKLIACIACSNKSTRLYGKPLQFIDIKKKISILENIIKILKKTNSIHEIVLAIADGSDNTIFKEYAKQYNIQYINGDSYDVLQRLIKACRKGKGTDIFRITSECPFFFYELINKSWNEHIKNNYDVSFLDNVPDGTGFEIIKQKSLKYSWKYGNQRHRSELCSLYIRENKTKFKINYISIPKKLQRKDLRITVDNPEDLILVRDIYNKFKTKAPFIPVSKIIKYLDLNPDKKKLVEKYIPDGLKIMYL